MSIYVLSRLLSRQDHRVDYLLETTWPAKSKTFTVWPMTGKVANSWPRAVALSSGSASESPGSFKNADVQALPPGNWVQLVWSRAQTSLYFNASPGECHVCQD